MLFGEAAISCANAGSQLVILAEDGTVYWPIAGTTPSSGQNPKLLRFAGQKVTATGTLYKRGGSVAIVIGIQLVTFVAFGFYNRWWRYVSTRDMWGAARGVTAANLLSRLGSCRNPRDSRQLGA